MNTSPIRQFLAAVAALRVPGGDGAAAAGPRGLFGLLAYSLVVAALFLAPTVAPATTPDSLAYLDAARTFTQHGSLGAGYLSWPPLYPVVLAPFVALHAQAWLGLLNFLLLAASVFAALLIFRALHCGLGLALLAGIVVAHAAPMRFVFPMVWSETLFIPLSLLWLLAWSRFAAHGKRGDLALACAAYGLCLLTRHAAMPMTAVMVAMSILPAGGSRTWHRGAVLAAIALAALPSLLWLGHVYALSGTLAGHRVPQPQPLGALLSGLAATLSHWLVPGVFLHGGDPLAVAACLALLAVPLAALALHLRKLPAAAPGSGAGGLREQLLATSAGFSVVYVLFVLWATHRTFLDIPGDRYLAPVYVPIAGLVLCGIAWLHGRLRRQHRAAVLAANLLGGLWVAADVLLP
ncbi:MAG: hypothetical protein ISP90_07360 [Nevskia sp.]|nr:hypothetical protein [Nevskia sp.]